MWDPATKFYDWTAPVYGWWAALTESNAHRRARAAIRAHPGGDVLEVAVGTGSEIGWLACEPSVSRLVGIDRSHAMLRQSRRRDETTRGRVLFCRADARALPFRAGCFDRVVNYYMIDLLPEEDILVALREFRRVLRPDGILVLLTMGRQRGFIQPLWMALFRHAPLLVGACRPVNAGDRLRRAGWRIENYERIAQIGFFTELFVARSPELR